MVPCGSIFNSSVQVFRNKRRIHFGEMSDSSEKACEALWTNAKPNGMHCTRYLRSFFHFLKSQHLAPPSPFYSKSKWFLTCPSSSFYIQLIFESTCSTTSAIPQVANFSPSCLPLLPVTTMSHLDNCVSLSLIWYFLPLVLSAIYEAKSLITPWLKL